jgi:integrase
VDSLCGRNAPHPARGGRHEGCSGHALPQAEDGSLEGEEGPRKVRRATVSFADIARALLEALSQRRTALGYVLCPGIESERTRDWRRWFEEAVRLAGIDNFRRHDLRHTFASRLVMAGVDLRSVRELLEHKTIAMTVRHSHPAPRCLQEAVERLTASQPTP